MKKATTLSLFLTNYIVVLEDGAQLKLSRSRREHLETRLKAIS